MTLTFSDGRTEEYDVLVGADDIDSLVRRTLWGNAPKREHHLHIFRQGHRDGYYLGRRLAGLDLTDPEVVRSALQGFEEPRRPHTARQSQTAYFLGQLFHHAPGPLRPVRDLVFDHTPFLQRSSASRPTARSTGIISLMVEESSTAGTDSPVGGGSSRAWQTLSSGFEQARAREDSLDRLVEWPAQCALLGDVSGLAILDAGCGNGAKIAQLVGEGATASVGVDISGNFIARPPGLELIVGDLSDLAAVPGLAGRRFDRILFLQSFGYAADPVRALRTARDMLTEDGFILLTRTQPVRYAIERAEQSGTSLGEEYFATRSFAYQHRGWDDQVTLTKRPYTMSDLLNVFSAAGLWIEAAVEPQMSAEAAERYPHKQAVMNKYLGILIFKLRPLPGATVGS